MTDSSELYDQALDACNRRDWQNALALSTQFLRQSPAHGGMHYVAGVASMELRRIPHAVEHLRRAVTLEPRRANFSTLYAKALSLAGLPTLPAADRALSLVPVDDAYLLMTLGMIYAQALAHERAVELFRQTIAIAPSHAPCHYSLAMSLIFLGDAETAEVELDTCIKLDPTFWKAYLSRSQVRRQTADHSHVKPLESLLSQQVEHGSSPTALVCLHMALSKEYEDLADYPMAFEHLTRGKSTAGFGRGYASQNDEALFSATARAFSTPHTPTIGCATEEPIFVIGMPRSGTTLIERILSSHPDVHSAGELQNFALAFKRASGSRTANILDTDTIDRAHLIDWQQLGANYLASTRPSTGHTPRFIDKLPHNFLYVGAIAQALPNARIVCLRRDSLDTCIGNFRQLFGESSPFCDYSYDLLDVGRYYILFDRLMAHWKQAFPDRIMEIHYETLVDAQESTTRRLLEYCGLSWDEACLHFENNLSPVATASALQVRKPIYRSSLGQWKKYENQLGALKQLLGNAGIITT
jgi:tetratricopeptide (TPR) repeat protein